VVGSGDELYGTQSALFQASSHHQLIVSLSAFLGFFFTESSCRVQLHVPLPSPVPSWHLTPSAAYSFSVPYLLFSCFFFCRAGVSCPGGYAGLSQGQLWEYHIPLICLPVSLHLLSRFGASVWWHGSPSVFSV
jgi:hypothetical protein